MLMSNSERNILVIKKHWALLLGVVMMFIVSPITFGITAVAGLYWLLRYFMDSIVLTNQRFVVRVGVISKKNISTPLDKINNISYSQGLLGRMFGFGTIVVQSAATAGASGYSFIANPASVQRAIENAAEEYSIEKAKRIHRLATASDNE